jgi:hypothetical protein
MKWVLFFLLGSFNIQVHAGAEALCSLYHSKNILEIAKKHSADDKNRHCTVSCMLTLKCPSPDVLMAGVLKEVQDVFGPGNAEVEDLKADALGISFARDELSLNNQECLNTCDLYYSP